MYAARQADLHCFHQLSEQCFTLWTEGREACQQLLLDAGREQDVRIVKDTEHLRRNDRFDLSRNGIVKSSYIG